MKAWLGVVSAEHVEHGVKLGIAQLGHGKRSGLARMQAPNWGYEFRRGLVELTLEDAALIRSALCRGGTQGKPRQ